MIPNPLQVRSRGTGPRATETAGIPVGETSRSRCNPSAIKVLRTLAFFVMRRAIDMQDLKDLKSVFRHAA